MESTMTLSQVDWHLIAGGLGLFLLGIKLMGDNLTKYAGTKIRDYIEKYTSNPIMAILVGIILTGLIQSSSATTVIAISLVRAGLMNLAQAIGITLGANIGTTVTAILIGFDLDTLAYFILLLGVVILMTAKKKKTSYLGEIVIGFGLLFIGLNIMGGALKELQNIAGFEQAIVKMSKHPALAALVGTVVTGVIQSSSAVVGIVQTLYQSGAITMPAALGLMFGANIGTTVTAAIASVGGSASAKRTFVFHFLFNVSISILFLLLMRPYMSLLIYLTGRFSLNRMMVIALGHFMFNFVGMLIYLPFIKQCVKILEKILPGKGEVSMDRYELSLDEQMITQFPAGALQQAKTAIENMAGFTLDMVKASREYLETKDGKYFTEVNQLEEIINSLDTKIESYLLKISKENLTPEIMEEYSINLQVAKNFERIGDLSQNLVEYYEAIFDAGESFDEDAQEDLLGMYDLLIKNYENGVEIYSKRDRNMFEIMRLDEKQLNGKEYQLKEAHFRRMTQRHEKATVTTSLFVDILSTLERIGDHAFNIGRTTLDPIKSHKEKI